MAKKAAPKKKHEVVLQIPDMGLTDAQIDSLKKSFKNELVSSMKERATVVIVVVVVRVVRELAD
jgi:hypothetical protein